MKQKFRKGQLVQSGTVIVLVTCTRGYSPVNVASFSGVVVDNFVGPVVWSIGTWSDGWNYSMFKPLKKHYLHVNKEVPAKTP